MTTAETLHRSTQSTGIFKDMGSGEKQKTNVLMMAEIMVSGRI